MRTTIRLDDDVLAAANELRRERDLTLGEAVNALARAGQPRSPAARRRFRQRTVPMGLVIDVSRVSEALDLLDGPEHR